MGGGRNIEAEDGWRFSLIGMGMMRTEVHVNQRQTKHTEPGIGFHV